MEDLGRAQQLGLGAQGDEVGGPKAPSQNSQAVHFPKHFGFQSKREISKGELVFASQFDLKINELC